MLCLLIQQWWWRWGGGGWGLIVIVTVLWVRIMSGMIRVNQPIVERCFEDCVSESFRHSWSLRLRLHLGVTVFWAQKSVNQEFSLHCIQSDQNGCTGFAFLDRVAHAWAWIALVRSWFSTGSAFACWCYCYDQRCWLWVGTWTWALARQLVTLSEVLNQSIKNNQQMPWTKNN